MRRSNCMLRRFSNDYDLNEVTQDNQKILCPNPMINRALLIGMAIGRQVASVNPAENVKCEIFRRNWTLC